MIYRGRFSYTAATCSRDQIGLGMRANEDAGGDRMGEPQQSELVSQCIRFGWKPILLLVALSLSSTSLPSRANAGALAGNAFQLGIGLGLATFFSADGDTGKFEHYFGIPSRQRKAQLRTSQAWESP